MHTLLELPEVDDEMPIDHFPRCRKMMKVREVCEVLDISERTVYRRVNDKTLPAVKFGSTWRFPRPLIEAIRDGKSCPMMAGEEGRYATQETVSKRKS